MLKLDDHGNYRINITSGPHADKSQATSGTLKQAVNDRHRQDTRKSARRDWFKMFPTRALFKRSVWKEQLCGSERREAISLQSSKPPQSINISRKETKL
ncbi:hypothetical protein ACJ73_05765 [Blastomyces percursus]|uniref:Uncharacterized protein n=1 Tax=Blastomyces percursus TaxID=1658174 RepID=A0A1J9R327_9EURO|nr:hypothetical protein ACJ73_05765 [Blastomyces percursus]